MITETEHQRLLIIVSRARAFLKADGCKIHRCGKSREQREALEECLLDPIFGLKLEIDAWLSNKGPMPDPFTYCAPEGRKVGTIPPRAPEMAYEDFWAQQAIENPITVQT